MARYAELLRELLPRILLSVGLGTAVAILTWAFLVPAARKDAALPNRLIERELNPFILAGMQELERNYRVTMMPPAKAHTSVGVVRDVYVNSRRVMKGAENAESHCIGLIFDLWVHAFQQARLTAGGPGPAIGDGTVSTFWALQKAFYGADGNRKTFTNALPAFGLGRVVPLNEAQPGDLVQFWRQTGSGHAGVFVGAIEHPKLGIVGLKLWSLTARRGLAVDNYSFMEGHLKADETYIVRPVF